MCQLGRDESWALTGPDGDSPGSTWRGGLCERSGLSLYGVAGLSRRNLSKRKSEKRDTRGQFGEFCSSHSSLFPTQPHLGGVEGPGESAHPGGPQPTSEMPGRVHTMKSPALALVAQRRVHTRTCRTRGYWGAGLEAGQVLIRN